MFGSFQFEVTSGYQHSNLFHGGKQYVNSRGIPNSYYDSLSIFANEHNHYFAQGDVRLEPEELTPIQRFYHHEHRKLGVIVRIPYHNQTLKCDTASKNQYMCHEPQQLLHDCKNDNKDTLSSSSNVPKTTISSDTVVLSASLSASPVSLENTKAFACPQCKYNTDRKNNLKRHIVTMHFDSDRKLECCGTNFRSKAKLREHVTLLHKNGYRCSICGRIFCRKALLRRHMTVHSGKKDFHCDLCSYATSHKSNLERHQKVHTKTSAPVNDISRKQGNDLICIHNVTKKPYSGTCQNLITEQFSYFADDNGMVGDLENRHTHHAELYDEFDSKEGTDGYPNEMFSHQNNIADERSVLIETDINNKRLDNPVTCESKVLDNGGLMEQDKSVDDRPNAFCYKYETPHTLEATSYNLKTEAEPLQMKITIDERQTKSYKAIQGKNENNVGADLYDNGNMSIGLNYSLRNGSEESLGKRSHFRNTLDIKHLYNIRDGMLMCLNDADMSSDGMHDNGVNLDINENNVTGIHNKECVNSTDTGFYDVHNECACVLEKENSENSHSDFLDNRQTDNNNLYYKDATKNNADEVANRAKPGKRLCILPYRCPTCRKRFQSQNDILVHVCEIDERYQFKPIENNVSLVARILKNGGKTV